MDTVNEIYDITNELKQLLEELPIDEDREEYINKIDKLLERRGKLIEGLSGVLSKEQENIIRKTIDLYDKEKETLNKLFKEIENDLLKTGQKKKLHNRYTQKPILLDGMFIDKRK
ncbi:MAG: hypothetical protein AB7V16_13020 [Vulcanibacillus sp.]